MSVPDKSSKQLKTKSWIGFYGCADRIVRIGWDGDLDQGQHSRDFGRYGPKEEYREVRPNSVPEFDCPACDRLHSVKFMWRPRKEDEEVERYV